ncbi:hypothetical protein [Halovulum sp. GXIMD14793]
MMKNTMMLGVIFLFLTGCLYLRPQPLTPPAMDWSYQVSFQCEAALGGDVHSPNDQCGALANCVLNRSVRSPLGSTGDRSRDARMYYDYYSLVPKQFYELDGATHYTMPFLRARAERSRPDAAALFSVMEDVRNTCLAETGLTGKIGRD